MKLIGLDVGGTKLECCIIEVSGEGTHPIMVKPSKKASFSILARKRCPTEREKGYEHILNAITELSLDTLKEANLNISDISGVGVVLPGTVDPVTGQFVLGNTNSFAGKSLQSDLKASLEFSKEVSVANDANCFVLSEAICGAGLDFLESTEKPFKTLSILGVILGTGCGGGYFSRGKIITGAFGGAIEIGHSLLKSNGRSCYCGSRGCAETYVSGTGLQNTYQEVAVTSEVVEGSEIFRMAEAGDLNSKKTLELYKGDLSLFLGNVSTILDPDLIILGGGVSEEKSIYNGLEERVSENTFLKDKDRAIRSSKFGGSSGVLGAAFLNL